MDTIRPIEDAHRRLAESLAEQGVRVHVRRLHRRERAVEVEGGADRAPAGAARRARALHAARPRRARRDECGGGRVRRGARSGDTRRAAVGPPRRLDERRPLVRRARALRPLPAVDPQAPGRGGRGRRATTSWSASSARSTWCARTRSTASGTSNRLARSGSLKPTPAYDIEVSLDALGLLDQMVAALQRDRLRRVQLRCRRWRRPVRVRLPTPVGARDGRQGDPLPARGEADREAARARRDVHAEAVRGGVGERRALQHEPRRHRRRRRTCSATRTTHAVAVGARRRTASWPASCGTRPRCRRSARRPSTPTSGSPNGSPTARTRGRRCGRPTATTTVRACCACRATGRVSRTAASTPPPTRTSPPRSCSPPDSKECASSWIPAIRWRT